MNEETRLDEEGMPLTSFRPQVGTEGEVSHNAGEEKVEFRKEYHYWGGMRDLTRPREGRTGISSVSRRET